LEVVVVVVDEEEKDTAGGSTTGITGDQEAKYQMDPFSLTIK